MNMFMPVYKQLEREVISLTNSILFNDFQKNVYSIALGNLLLRCVVEIEAISKELYCRLGGNPNPVDTETVEAGKAGKERNLYFDTDCIQLLVDKWHIDKKKIQISHSNMYFTDASLTPLYKANKRGKNDWKKAYQSFKHNRSEGINTATVWNMLSALGALYILNLYYADETFWYDAPIEGMRKYATSSEIFTPALCNTVQIGIPMDTNFEQISKLTDPTFEESIFILKYTDEAYKAMQQGLYKLEITAEARFRHSKEYKDFMEQHPQISQEADAHTWRTLIATMGISQTESRLYDGHIIKEAMQKLKEQEVVLNKGEDVYPMNSMDAFLASEEGKAYKHHVNEEFEKNPEMLNVIRI